jgi:NTE family protein
VGVGLSSDFSGMTAFALQLSYRKTWLNRLGAEWRTDAQLGNNNSVRSEFYQPLQSSRRPWYVAPNLVLEQHRVNLYQGEDRVASYAVSSGLAGVDLGLQLEPYGTLRMGIEGGQVRQEFIVGPESLRPSVSNLKHDGFSAGAFFDQLDNVVVPRRGWTAQAQVFSSSPSLGADHAYTKWSASAMGAYSFGENTLNLAVKGAGRIGNNPLPAYEQFQWGGFLRQSGYSTGQFTGQSLQYARAMYMRRIFKGELFEGAYGGAAFEWSKVGQPLLPGNPDGLLKSMTLFVALDTLVGPLYLAYGHAATGASSLYFYLGRPF